MRQRYHKRMTPFEQNDHQERQENPVFMEDEENGMESPMSLSNNDGENCEKDKRMDEYSNFASDSNKQKASNIAVKAAMEAKAASDAQNVAGQQASHQVIFHLRLRVFIINFIFRSRHN